MLKYNIQNKEHSNLPSPPHLHLINILLSSTLCQNGAACNIVAFAALNLFIWDSPLGLNLTLFMCTKFFCSHGRELPVSRSCPIPITEHCSLYFCQAANNTVVLSFARREALLAVTHFLTMENNRVIPLLKRTHKVHNRP